jgi:uncharacterized membrane protein YtjA (UPF0391 family)
MGNRRHARPGGFDRMLPPGTRFSKTKLSGRGLSHDTLSLDGTAVEPAPSPEVRSAILMTPLMLRCGGWRKRAMTILKWALIFFVVSIVAGVLGFTGISAASADVARFLFYVFVVIFLVLLILGLTIFRV